MRRIDSVDVPPKDQSLGDDSAWMLALDEALLMAAESGEVGASIRTWEFERLTVVLGRSSKVDRETDRAACEQRDVEIYRRCSGGATIAGGPGCLMYSLVLPFAEYPDVGKIDGAHKFVMGRVLEALQRQLPDIRQQGICDLTWNDRKFSGNALRLTRNHVLYHGTILYDADLDAISQCLDFAPRQPDYRQGRRHRDFLVNAPLDPGRFGEDLAADFGAVVGPVPDAVVHRADELVAKRYSCEDWRYRH